MALPLGGEQALSPKQRAAHRAALAAGKTAGLAIPGLGEAELALAVAGKAADIATRDLFTINGTHYRQVTVGKGRHKQTVLVPVSWTVHGNLLNLGLGVIAAGVALFGGLVFWNGVVTAGFTNRSATQVLPGARDTIIGTRGKALAASHQRHVDFDHALTAHNVSTAQAIWDNANGQGDGWTRYRQRPK